VPTGRDYTEIGGGYYHSLALKVDRSIVAWGGNGDGQCNVPAGTDFVHIAAGSMHSIALKADGTIVAWGRDAEGQCRAPVGSDFIAIAAGAFHNLALQADGHIEAWGQNDNGQCDTPPTQGFAIIAAGGFRSLAIRDNRPAAARPPRARIPVTRLAPQKDEQKDADVECVGPLVPVSTQAAQPRQTQVKKESPTDVTSRPKSAIEQTPKENIKAAAAADPNTKPGSTPAQRPALPGSDQPQPSASGAGKPPKPPAPADANAPLDLNDLVRQGLAADLYLEASGSAVPVYHFTSISPPDGAAGPKQHFCTISEQEKYKLIDNQSKAWKYEGIAFFAYAEGRQPPGARPVYRFWSQSLNRYFFTMDEAQKQMLIDKLAQTWKYEGLAWYAPPLKTSDKK
jgi:hypothetical protein